MKRIIYSLYIIGLVAVLLLQYQCAQIGTISGGPKDRTPPLLLSEYSTPNYQTNFSKQEIELAFDEFVVLKDLTQEVTVSPPLNYFPSFKTKGKSVLINFNEKETLRENATYTIDLGEAIRDLTEGNANQNLKFVFSTGPVIDSLQVKGMVIDAMTGKAADKTTVLLYDVLEDSIVYNELPLYFGKTDASGKFAINNVRADTFKVIALQEEYNDYKYNPTTESIAFLDTAIIVKEGELPYLNLTIFRKNPESQIIKIDSSEYGVLKFTIQGDASQINIENANPNRAFINTQVEDSIYYWYSLEKGEKDTLFIQDAFNSDTIFLASSERDTLLKDNGIRLLQPSSQKTTSINPFKPIRLEFSEPIVNMDTTKIVLYTDSIRQIFPYKINIDSIDARVVKIQANLASDTIYSLEMLPQAIEGIRGSRLKDTLNLNFQKASEGNFGSIQLHFLHGDSLGSYWVRLFFKRDNLVESFSVAMDSIYSRKWEGLPSGEYHLQIVRDENNNQRWDSGDYEAKRQAEKQIIKALENVRAGWEVDTEIDLPYLFDKR